MLLFDEGLNITVRDRDVVNLTLIAVFYNEIALRGVVATKRAELCTRIRYCVIGRCGLSARFKSQAQFDARLGPAHYTVSHWKVFIGPS